MNIPCPNHVDCPCSTDPTANLSAEAADSRRWIGIMDVPQGKFFCVSAQSQHAADDCANRGVTGGVTIGVGGTGGPSNGVTPGTPGGGIKWGGVNGLSGGPSGGGPGWFSGPWYGNKAQKCCVLINSKYYCYTLPANTVYSFSQRDADARAYSLACYRAEGEGFIKSTEIDFLTDPAANGCVGDAYSFYVQCYSETPPTDLEPWFFEVISGALPPGLALDQMGGTSQVAHITGTPTTAGTYAFKIRVTPVYGDYSEMDYTITVLSVTPGTLPDGDTTTAYSQTIATTGGSGTYQYTVDTGSLPPGLTLDSSTGLISGTPTTVGTYAFTIKIEDIG